MSDIVERLRTPIDADKIYDWVIQKRKETRSDLPRLGFCNDMGLIDEEREEAATEITRLHAERDALLIALHDAIRRPMGVVPASADPFYNPVFAAQAEVRRIEKDAQV